MDSRLRGNDKVKSNGCRPQACPPEALPLHEPPMTTLAVTGGTVVSIGGHGFSEWKYYTKY